MAERLEIRRIQLRRDFSIAWTTNNPILADGEIGIEKDTRQFKVGNGIDPWTTLPYGGIQGPPGAAGFVSSDADNRLTHGTDGGLYVPDLTMDILDIYEQAKT